MSPNSKSASLRHISHDPQPSPRQKSHHGVWACFCVHCGKGFSQTRNLDRHSCTRKQLPIIPASGCSNPVSPGIIKKPFICSCGKALSNKAALTRHIRALHQRGYTSTGAVSEPTAQTHFQAEARNQEEKLNNARKGLSQTDTLSGNSRIDLSSESGCPSPATSQDPATEAENDAIEPELSRNIESRIAQSPSFRVMPIGMQAGKKNVEADFADSVYIEWQIWSLHGHPE